MLIVSRENLSVADLHVDAVYEGGRQGNSGDDPLHRLLGVSNQGGFRILGTKERPRLAVLTTSLSDPEWPDELDLETGVFTYFGDNKKPGRDLHDTPRYGNLLLRAMFDATHVGSRENIPVILVFSNAGHWRDVIFRGLAVPGAQGLSPLEDLVAVWRVSGNQRFQNYRAKLTILDAASVKREWIRDIQAGKDPFTHAPPAWIRWVRDGKYAPLRTTRSLDIRNKSEQLPREERDKEMLKCIVRYFNGNPHGFEACAAEITRIALGRVSSIDLTRPTRDGGRDGIGRYQIGSGPSSIDVDFALEAKCYAEETSVGVRELSRLISRLRHRQFGVMVTTSWIHAQAYTEIREDAHPIVVIAGADIVRILKSHGLTSPESVQHWLSSGFLKNTEVQSDR
jgi:hypothetical protein